MNVQSSQLQWVRLHQKQHQDLYRASHQEFITTLHNCFQEVLLILREEKLVTKSFHGTYPHLFSNVPYDIDCARVSEVDLWSLRKECEWIQHLVLIALLSIKGVDETIPITKFDSTLQEVYADLSQPLEICTAEEDKIIAQFRSYIEVNSRTCEIRWILHQPDRFKSLVDPLVYSNSQVKQNLEWFRSLSQIELAFLTQLSTVDWNNVCAALLVPADAEKFKRFHLFALSAWSSLLASQNKTIGREDPLHLLIQHFRAFLPPEFELRMRELRSIISMEYATACLNFAELQLLPTELAWVRTIQSYFATGASTEVRKWETVWKSVTSQKSFLEKWEKVQECVRGHKHIAHPYWTELHHISTQDFREEALALVTESAKLQQAATEKNYYPTCYLYYPYFAAAWVIFIILIVLLIIALSAHHRTIYVVKAI